MKLILTLLFLSTYFCGIAQDTIEPDSAFAQAQKLANSGKYAKAIIILRKLTKEYPTDYDYSILLGTVFHWVGKNDSALALLKTAEIKDPKDDDALDALTDVESSMGHLQVTLAYCDTGIQRFGTNPPLFWLKKAQVLEQLNRDDEAKAALATYLKAAPGDKDGLKLQETLRKKCTKNKLALSYVNSSFWDPYFPSWNFGFIEYTRQFRNCPLIGRINYGNIPTEHAYSYQVDAYPVFRKGTYCYLNVGYSPDKTVLPTFQAGGDLYQALFKYFEVSLGAVYMNFNGSSVDIYSGYIGSYFGNWWVAYKNYLVIPEGKLFNTHTLNIRRYLKDKDVYLTFYAIYGVTPYVYTLTEALSGVKAVGLGFDVEFRVANSLLIWPMIMYQDEEYYPGLSRNRIDAQLTLTYEF